MKLIKKLLLFFIIIGFISIVGIILYVKLSPKIIINSANKIILYDKNNKPFFSRNDDTEWADLDDISESFKLF